MYFVLVADVEIIMLLKVHLVHVYVLGKVGRICRLVIFTYILLVPGNGFY
jgi:hypothetical protein